MKKIFSIVFIGLFAILITGCFGNTDNNSDNGSNNNGSNQNPGGNNNTPRTFNHNTDNINHVENYEFIQILPSPLPGTMGNRTRGGTYSNGDKYFIYSFSPHLTVAEGRAYAQELERAGIIPRRGFEEHSNNLFGWNGEIGDYTIIFSAVDIRVSKR